MIHITRAEMSAGAATFELKWFDDHFPEGVATFATHEELLLFGIDSAWPNFREWLARFRTNISFARASLRGANLRGCCLTGADFSHADLRGVNFVKACLVGARFFYTQLEGANLNSADIRGATFDHVDLSKTVLHGAYRRDIDTRLPYWEVHSGRCVIIPSDNEES